TELSRDNPSSLYLRGARQAVKTRMVEAADRVISSYRNTGAVYENGWKGAREELMHALALGPDESVRGKLRPAGSHNSRSSGRGGAREGGLDRCVGEIGRGRAPAAGAARSADSRGAPGTGIAAGFRPRLHRAPAGGKAWLRRQERARATGRRLPRPRQPRIL